MPKQERLDRDTSTPMRKNGPEQSARRQRTRNGGHAGLKAAIPGNDWLWNAINRSRLDGLKNPEIFTPKCRGGFASSALIYVASHLK